MLPKTVLVYILAISILGFPKETRSQEATNRVQSTHEFSKVTIKQLESVSSDKLNRILARKIQILTKDKEPGLLWQITSDGLPVKDKDCFEADTILCKDYSDPYLRSLCHGNCVIVGPEFLAFDELNQKIYFYAPLGTGGTGGGPCLLFVGDLSTKSLHKLAHTERPIFDALLSPTGQLLALGRRTDTVEILDTKTGKTIRTVDTGEVSARKGGQFQMRPARWVSEDRLLVTEEEYRDKFSDQIINKTEKVIHIK